jgi:hypothetical protein
MRRGTLTPSRIIAGVLAALLAWGYSASAVRADCGDYVHVQNPTGDMQPDAPRDSQTETSFPAPRIPHSPCGAMGCAPAPAAPATTAPLSVNGPEQWALAANMPALLAAIRGWIATDPNSPVPERFPTSIFHPPRVS